MASDKNNHPFQTRQEVASYLLGAISRALHGNVLRYQLRISMGEVDEPEGLLVEFDG